MGNGDFYYLACNLEESIWNKFNQWHTEDSYLFYAALKPEANFRIDNKYVEFYHKRRGNDELLVMLNHENSAQDVLLISKDKVSLEDAITGKPYEKHTSFCFHMKPAEILFLNVIRKKTE